MDKYTRSIIEEVVIDLCKQGLKIFDCKWKNISTISDNDLLDFIKTYYD